MAHRLQFSLFITLPALVAVLTAATFASAAEIIVAAQDSSLPGRQTADFVCTGHDDQNVIRQAILSLPEAGGTVRLLEGTFHIHHVPETLGGIIIDRSRVTLTGQGFSTRLRLAAGQNTNVIRIIGSGTGRIIIRDLVVDANRAENDQGRGDPNISHDRFEFCGIKAYRQAPGKSDADVDCHDITIQNCHVKDAHRLGIMLEGPNMRVLDNTLNDAGSDVVEILTGPGIIRGNHVDIFGQTHVALGTDRADNIVMADNVIRIRDGGKLDIGFRSWAGSVRHAITGNVLTVDPGGFCTTAIDLRGTRTAVTGNVIHGGDHGTLLKVGGGHTTITGNVLENVLIDVDDSSGTNHPVLLGLNALDGSRVELKQGRVVDLDSVSDKTTSQPTE